jgi:hypothetical protein
MALTSALSTKELERVALAAYSGKEVRVSLAFKGTAGLTVESATSLWDAEKISGNGYQDFLVTVPAGGYDTSQGRWEIGALAGPDEFINAEFTATGAGYTFDSVYVVIDNSIYLHSLLSESPAVVLQDGQVITYRIQLILDN